MKHDIYTYGVSSMAYLFLRCIYIESLLDSTGHGGEKNALTSLLEDVQGEVNLFLETLNREKDDNAIATFFTEIVQELTEGIYLEGTNALGHARDICGDQVGNFFYRRCVQNLTSLEIKEPLMRRFDDAFNKARENRHGY